MSEAEIFMTNPFSLVAQSFYPRNYSPEYLLVKDGMKDKPFLASCIDGKINGGSTPPAYFFYSTPKGIPFVKTSAVTRHFINVNDLQSINSAFHRKKLKRSITKPYDVIYTMTGKFMGKAALCPCTISEMNMSQNSVVFHMRTPEEAAFLTIFLNSQVNRIQVKGTYSITKQKFMNQGKIAKLHVLPYDNRYEALMKAYLTAFDVYYKSIKKIQEVIDAFNKDFQLQYQDTAQYGFTVSPSSFDKRMLVPNFYRTDIASTLNAVQNTSHSQILDYECLSKGNEVGSANYSEDGVPFIKTSDIVNFDIDYEPDCYCPDSFIFQLNQDIKRGDIIFAKDGKPGEIAVIQEDCNVVISSGLVKYRAKSENERYWVLLLLSSNYGKAYFKKWFVIASTMLHLRADFFKDFQVTEVTDSIMDKYVNKLKHAFDDKKEAYSTMRKVCRIVEKSYTNPNIELSL